MMQDPWPLLTLEVSPKTLPRLIPLSVPFEIDSSKFYIAVVNKIFRELPKNESGFISEEFVTDLSTMKNIRDCLEGINDEEIAVGLAKFCSDQFTCSRFKIEALKYALTRSEKWHQNMLLRKVLCFLI